MKKPNIKRAYGGLLGLQRIWTLILTDQAVDITDLHIDASLCFSFCSFAMCLLEKEISI